MPLWRKKQKPEAAPGTAPSARPAPTQKAAAALPPEDVAEAIMARFSLVVGGSTDPRLSQAVDAALRDCPGRSEAMVAAAVLVAGIETPRARRIAAEALSTAGATYRPQAIEALTTYLAGPLDESTYRGVTRTVCGKQSTPAQEAAIHQANMWKALGKAYEGEYAFDEAEQAYRQAWTLAPFFPDSWVSLAQVLIKQGRMDDAVALLEQAEASAYFPAVTYKVGGQKFVDDLFKQVITGQLADTRAKQARGYVYKPRKKKATDT